jgi:hypothetical protein
MSRLQIDELKPVDILNITFEHNRKKEQLKGVVSSKSKSSSSSLKNEASFNIFEEKPVLAGEEFSQESK